MKFQQHLDGFANFLLLEKQVAHNTAAAYLSDVKILLEIATLLEIDISKATSEHLYECLYILSKKNLNERSQARWISSVKAFYRYLLEENIRPDDPTLLLESPKLGLYLPDTLSTEEIDKIVAVSDNTALGKRNQAIIEVLYGCGLRVSELINLRISDINFKEHFLRIKGKGDKTRLVPLAKYTAEILSNYLHGIRTTFAVQEGHQDYVFLNVRGKKLTRVMVFIIVKKLATSADLSKTISPHTFRHSYATHLLENGADLRYIQEMLGHSSITTTEIYTHLKTEALHTAILEYHPRNRANRL